MLNAQERGDMIAFVNARLDDTEFADWHTRDCQTHQQMPANSPLGLDGAPLSCNCGVPAWLLADVAAKRAIVELYAEHSDYDDVDNSYEHASGRICGLGEAIRLLALASADHPDYRDAWRPDVDE